MICTKYSKINMNATGQRIAFLFRSQGYCVKDMQEYFGFSSPQAIYKWLRGKSLPSIDNLFALSKLLHIPVDAILVAEDQDLNRDDKDLLQATLIAPQPRTSVSYHYVSRGELHSLKSKGSV